MKRKFDYTGHHRSAFEQALAEIPNGHGHRNTRLLPTAAYHAVKIGITEEEYATRIAEASSGCDPLKPSEIHRAYRTAAEKIGCEVSNGSYSPHCTPAIRSGAPLYVPALIEAGGKTAAIGDLAALSPTPTDIATDSPQGHTAAFLRALWHPEEILYLFRIENPSSGIPGANLKSQSEWVAEATSRGIYLDGLVPNPFTGLPKSRPDGTVSYITKESLASFPYALIEFDNLPLDEQCALWLGYLRHSTDREKLAALTFSGGKSIHALLYIGEEDIVAQTKSRNRLTDLFACHPDKRYRADPAGFTPRQGTRLPGVKRDFTGPLQQLIYLNPNAREIFSAK